jgi:CubicO group peptidase (beta-lactamase class C family)
MGILLAATIVERLTKIPFRDFLRKELFAPLGMSATSLGLGGRAISDMARSQVEEVSDWDWNSTYWRDLGAPWGGAHAPASDVARFFNYFANPAQGPLRSATTAQMISLQTGGLNESWGLGFRIGQGAFGRSCSARTFGHYGSTGTVAWHDPDTRVTCVLLTTKPAASSRQHLLGPVSDAVAEAAAAS